MYTAKIANKEMINGVVKVYVDFTDGVNTVQETCIPQDEDGFKFWVRSRLATFNAAETINATYAKDSVVDVSDPVVTPPKKTVAEIARDEWFANYSKWLRVKSTLIDTGVLTGNETKVVALLNKVRADFLPAYLDFI